MDQLNISTPLSANPATVKASAVGSDSNIHLYLASLGTGKLLLNNVNLGVDTTGAMVFGNGTSATSTGTGTIVARPLGGDLAGTSAASTVIGIRGTAVSGVQGSGPLAQLSKGTVTPGDCANFDADGNTVDAGSRCAAAPTGSATFAFGSPICDGCCLQGGTTITVAGASIGDAIAIGASPSLGAGIDLFGKVTGASTVAVEVCNWTGAAVTPGSTTYKAADVRTL